MEQGKQFWRSLYFIPLRRGSKIPAVKWGGYDTNFDENEDVLRYDDLEPNGYYGYMAHERYQLGVVDIDLYKDLAPDPDVMTYHDGALVIKTPSGGFHFPFLVPDGDAPLKVKDKYEDWIDLKGDIRRGHAVLPFGSDYEIVQDGKVRVYSSNAGEHTSIVQVDEEGVLEIDNSSEEVWEGESPYNSVYNLLDRGEFPPQERRPHPIHGSSTGMNFMVDENEETWRCWRHETTGNLLHLLGMKWGILDCGEWNDHSEPLGQKYNKIKEMAREMQIDLRKAQPKQVYDGVMEEIYG